MLKQLLDGEREQELSKSATWYQERGGDVEMASRVVRYRCSCTLDEELGSGHGI